MITVQQIRAARGLLNWSQSELAEKTGLTQRAITGIETGKSRPSFTSLEALESILKQNGVEFIEDGVRQIKERINIIKGPEFAGHILDFVYNHIKSNGLKEVLLYGVDQRLLSLTERSKVTNYVNKVYEMGATERVLTSSSVPSSVLIGKASRYRALPDEYFSATNPTFIFGNCVATLMFDLAEAWIIDNEAQARTQRKLYELLWTVAKPIK